MMSSKSERSANVRREASSTSAETRRHSIGNESPDEEIRHRAYEIYLERGSQAGSALEDWLQAKSEIQQRDQGASSEHGGVGSNR
jgi:Protein of unknown function (DUF2934)